MENAKTFNFDGMELLTSWDGKYGEHLRKAKRAARRLKSELEFIHGDYRSNDIDEVFGLAYTSSSDFAAVWNTNAEARIAGTRLYFDGIAINTAGEAVGVFTERDEAGDEIGLKCMII